MQKIKTEEDSPLKQEEEETDTVPDNAGLFHRQRAILTTH